VVDDEPVSRRTFTDWLVDACGRPAPRTLTVEQFLSERDPSAGRRRRLTADKHCSNAKLHTLGYELRFPTFRGVPRGCRRALPSVSRVRRSL
jgi:hypothetical protein